MRFQSLAGRLLNRALLPLGFQIQRLQTEKAWDSSFREWINKARAAGVDPNDIGDTDWSDDPLQEALSCHYLPHVRAGATLLELGPGTGRLTRHVISRCAELILVDYSALVCEWMSEYLRGKGKFSVNQIDKPELPMVRDCSVDAVFANGVFEHIDPDDLYGFLTEFNRVLKPGGVVCFNFDNIMTAEGLAHFKRFRGPPGGRNLFRFYHPDAVALLARDAGFHVLRVSTGATRFAFIELEKP